MSDAISEYHREHYAAAVTASLVLDKPLEELLPMTLDWLYEVVETSRIRLFLEESGWFVEQFDADGGYEGRLAGPLPAAQDAIDCFKQAQAG